MSDTEKQAFPGIKEEAEQQAKKVYKKTELVE
jgi:hypothetical protein